MHRSHLPPQPQHRRGNATLDYVLVLGVILPIVGFVLPPCRMAIQASFAWFCRVVSCPFL